MPVSAARLAANRANAQLSTGPRTQEGKERSFLNRFSHGLSGSTFLLQEWENREAFEHLQAELLAEHLPATPTEVLLVKRMAEHHWLRGRALMMQDLCFHPHPAERHDSGNQLALFLRYEITHERAFHRCLAELFKLKRTRLQSPNGFESQNTLASVPESREAKPRPRHEAAPPPPREPTPRPARSPQPRWSANESAVATPAPASPPPFPCPSPAK